MVHLNKVILNEGGSPLARNWQGGDKPYLDEASSETRNLQMGYPVTVQVISKNEGKKRGRGEHRREEHLGSERASNRTFCQGNYWHCFTVSSARYGLTFKVNPPLSFSLDSVLKELQWLQVKDVRSWEKGANWSPPPSSRCNLQAWGGIWLQTWWGWE